MKRINSTTTSVKVADLLPGDNVYYRTYLSVISFLVISCGEKVLILQKKDNKSPEFAEIAMSNEGIIRTDAYIVRNGELIFKGRS